MKHDTYLGVITQSKQVGDILGKKIHQIVKVEFIKYFGNQNINMEDKKYLDMIDLILSYKHFYFSNEYDLTQCLQENLEKKMKIGKWNERCFWNLNRCHKLLGFQEFLTLVISGMFEQQSCEINNNIVQLSVISRREWVRSGMRFISRGADLDGNVSNYVQTEQIVQIKDSSSSSKIYSYVQTRGSMPFIWKQTPNLQWSPKPNIYQDYELNLEVSKRHFNQECSYSFGKKQVLINLIDKKGSQLLLGNMFTKIIQDSKDPRLRYIWFDFHAECKNMQWQNLNKLIGQVQNEFSEQDLLKIELSKQDRQQFDNHMKVMSRQKGVFRTNCMDCLDRTNVVQSVLGRQILYRILNENGLMNHIDKTNPFQVFPGQLEQIFRNIWTNNANIISLFYTGTGALKTDFTKTGNRTILGALQDGKNSIHRYILNHYYDAYNQNAIDFFLNKLHPNQYHIQKPKSFIYLTLITIVMPLLIKKSYDYNQNSNSPSIFANMKYLISLILIQSVIQFAFFKSLQSNYKSVIQQPIIKQ